MLFLFNFLLISNFEITTACLALPNHMAATREDVTQHVSYKTHESNHPGQGAPRQIQTQASCCEATQFPFQHFPFIYYVCCVPAEAESV